MPFFLFILSFLVALGTTWSAYHHQTLIPIITCVLAWVLFAVLVFSTYYTDRGRTL